MSLGSPDRSSIKIGLAAVIQPLESYIKTSSAERNIPLSADSISLCVEMLAEFGDKALQPSYAPWASVDFHGRTKIHAGLTKTYKNARVAANVGTDADVTLSSRSPEKLLPPKKHPAQRPRIDLGKTSKAVAAETCASKLRSPGASANGDTC